MTRVVVLARNCILDPRSGGAIELRTMLEALAASGCECHSITMTCFDGQEEFPLDRVIEAAYTGADYRHRFLAATHRGVRHLLFTTASTVADNLARDEVVTFGRGASRQLDEIRPDIIVTTGGGTVARALHLLAEGTGAVRIFYLANPDYQEPGEMGRFDHVLCPSRTLADRYRERLGIDAGVMPNVIDRRQFVESPPRARLPAPARRFVTMVNPVPEKGACLFFRLARLAAAERPDMRFLAVESRMSRAAWRGIGIDPMASGNVFWVRNRSDMRPVYRRTAVLLFPSLWFEAAGRVPVEAQLSGIPVLATRRAAIPEQLNGGGYLFDPPADSLEDYLHMPATSDVRPWLECIKSLLDEPDTYAAASARAMEAAAHFHPDVRGPALAQAFERMAGERR